eukprot:g31578.t1
MAVWQSLPQVGADAVVFRVLLRITLKRTVVNIHPWFVRHCICAHRVTKEEAEETEAEVQDQLTVQARTMLSFERRLKALESGSWSPKGKMRKDINHNPLMTLY